ncbi:hypothetical protein RD792_000088 [Penstemon davidsonii]|uniref:Pectin acetylesterase n=1 Tax=Penstemon davidsonii TaxID=160366 RepID=A0ABR0DU53_9LAMI|nr:hypothetical protein RD792_000088 [Penstemon davidsonii]
MNVNAMTAALSLLILLTCAPVRIYSQPERRLVSMTLVRNASSLGAFCLDGSLPAYHLDRGFGAGARNWVLQFEGGGWCNDIKSCLERAPTRRGSTSYMSKTEVFSGILSNNASFNPGVICNFAFFFILQYNRRLPVAIGRNWLMVFVPLVVGNVSHGVIAAAVDGGAPGRRIFSRKLGFRPKTLGGAQPSTAATINPWKMIPMTSLLYFRGQRIWQAIIQDLLPKGLAQAKKALLSGCSAGGLATFHHCDGFASFLPKNASVKCLSDAGFFLNGRDIARNYTMRYFFKGVVSLQGVAKNLDKNCTSSLDPELCFFPQYALPYIRTPYFILNSAYDVYQFHHILVPPSADPHGHWYHCKLDPAACNAVQINTLQGFRKYMLETLHFFLTNSTRGGMFINSCFAHCQSEDQDTWLAPDSPRVNNVTISKAVGDWYFSRSRSKAIDCPYPCDKTCHNLIP